MEYAKLREEEKKWAFLPDFKSSRLRQTIGIPWGKVDEGTAWGTVQTAPKSPGIGRKMGKGKAGPAEIGME